MHLDTPEAFPPEPPDADLAFEDRWILSRLARTARTATAALDEYRLNDAAAGLYEFVWKEFCDWYLEIVKPRLYSDATDETARRDRAAARSTLAHTLSAILRLLHPFVPFVTEEIHGHLDRTTGRETGFVARAPWPASEDGRIDEATDAEMETLISITRTIRNIRAEMNVPEGAKLKALVSVADEYGRELVLRHAGRISLLARLESLTADVGAEKPAGSAFKSVGDMEVYLPLGDVIDLDAEWDRVQKEREKVEGQLRVSEQKLSNQDFRERAPARVVERETARRDELATRLTAIQRHLASLDELRG
jgi:valyl-tRNA synthetase